MNALNIGQVWRSVSPSNWTPVTTGIAAGLSIAGVGLVFAAVANRCFAQERPTGHDLAHNREYLERAVSAGDRNAMYCLAWLLWREEDNNPETLARVRGLFEQAVDNGLNAARPPLAYMLQLGQGGEENQTLARQLYEQAVTGGDHAAIFNLATMVRSGIGGPKDQGRARQLYQQAMTNGNGRARMEYARMLEFGQGGPKDATQARRLYHQGMTKGDTKATLAYARMLEFGQGGAEDVAQARQIREQAAAQGRRSALVRLHMMLVDHGGGPEDVQHFRELCEPFVSRGDPDARYRLAHSYVAYEPRDLGRAKELFEQGTTAGGHYSQLALAGMLTHGQGGEKDIIRARELYEDLVTKGDRSAKRRLARNLLMHEPKNLERAKRLLEEVCSERGIIVDKWEFARLLEEGRFGEKELDRARALYEESLVEWRELMHAPPGTPENTSDDTLPEIAVWLAQMLRKGEGGPADPQRARRLLESAADCPLAKQPLAEMLERGEGGPQNRQRAAQLRAEHDPDQVRRTMADLMMHYPSDPALAQRADKPIVHRFGAMRPFF